MTNEKSTGINNSCKSLYHFIILHIEYKITESKYGYKFGLVTINIIIILSFNIIPVN